MLVAHLDDPKAVATLIQQTDAITFELEAVPDVTLDSLREAAERRLVSVNPGVDALARPGELPPLPVPRGPEADPSEEAAEAQAETTAEAPVEAVAEPEPITELRVADVTEVDDRTVDLAIESPSVGVRNVRLILPASWDEEPDATWPSLYLLHGQGGNYTNWTEDTDIAPRVAEELGLDVLMVMPDGEASYYSDWWNYGEGNDDNAWATFHIEELPAILETDWRADERRAVAGLSMGGFGAMSYAARYPGHFRSAASYRASSNSANMVCRKKVPRRFSSALPR